MFTHKKTALAKAAAALALCAAVSLLAAPAPAQEKGGFSSQQRDQVKGLVREYILENPEIISEAIVALQAKEERARTEKQAKALATHKDALFNPTENTIIGNPKGNVTVVEFFDYNCGYCKSMFSAVREILEDDSDVRMVMKEFPILGPGSVVAARAALASREQGKYSELHMALLGHKGSLNQASVEGIANDVGLNIDKLRADMNNPDINEILGNNMALAQDLGIEGTPALIVGDKLIPGAIGVDRLRDLIADARK
jgi:protein-disulfide isomerase